MALIAQYSPRHERKSLGPVTPRAILHALNNVISTGLNAPAMVKRLAADGTEPAPSATPEEIKALIAREYALVEKQVKGSKDL